MSTHNRLLIERQAWLIRGILRKGHVRTMRLLHEKTGMTAEELAIQYRSLNLTSRFIDRILNYEIFKNA